MPFRISLAIIGLFAFPVPVSGQQTEISNMNGMTTQPKPQVRDGLSTAPSGRTQLAGGRTPLKVSPVATTSPLYRTPLPLEMLDWAAYPPPTSVLRLPFDGEARIGGGYGYENRLGYSHQTIGNVNSANDFFAVDFDLEVGRPVLAVAAGRVISSISRKDSYGEYVVIEQDDGLRAIYAHLDSRRFDVVNGVPEVRVAAGEQIGTAGRSGNQRWPHLHFALHKGSRLSAHGADIGGLAVCPEPFGGYYGLRKGHVLRHDPVLLRPATRFD